MRIKGPLTTPPTCQRRRDHLGGPDRQARGCSGSKREVRAGLSVGLPGLCHFSAAECRCGFAISPHSDRASGRKYGRYANLPRVPDRRSRFARARP